MKGREASKKGLSSSVLKGEKKVRRNWIKLYVDQVLRGSMFDEMENPAERFIWFGFLVLAGDSAYEGQISVTDKIGYTDEQIAELLRCEVELIRTAKEVMIKFDKITVNEKNIIKVVNWKKYQSEYQRQKGYRGKLQGKVTGKGNDTDRDRDRDRDNSSYIYSPEFEGFWKVYPRKEQKVRAYEKYNALLKKKITLPDKDEPEKITAELIMLSLKGYLNALKIERVHNNFNRTPMMAKVFLNKNTWVEFIGVEYRPPL